MANIGKPPCDDGAVLAAKPPSTLSANKNWVLAASVLGSSMAFIDGTVVNVALPALQTSLHGSVAQVQWVVEAYALLLAALLLVGGAAGDLYGRRNVFLWGVGVFTAASVGCALSRNMGELIATRGLQGVGAALLVPGSLALISEAFPQAERGRAIGTWSGLTAITSAAGPVIGGWLIQNASWRWIFLLNIPIGLAVTGICWWRVPVGERDTSGTKLDWVGAALATMGLAGVTFALVEANSGSIWAVVTGLSGVVSLLVFLVLEMRIAAPMLPLSLFRSRNFAGANLLTLTLYTGLAGVLFFLPLNLIQVQGYSATEAGAALLPFVALMFGLSRWSGGLVQSYGPKLPLVIGPLIAGAGFALFGIARTGLPYWNTIFPAVLVLGLGMTISVAPLTTTVMTSVDEHRAGVASGINNAVSRLAGLLGVAVFGLILVAIFNHSLTARLGQSTLAAPVREQIDSQRANLAAIKLSDIDGVRIVHAAFLDGYRIVLWTAAALAAVSSFTALLLIESPKNKEKLKS